MKSTTGRELLAILEASGVLPHDCRHACAELVRRSPGADCHALLERLHRAQWLTSFQVARIEADAWPELVVGNYRLLECLGQDPLGDVYRAEHIHLRHGVVIRLVRHAAAALPRLVEHLRAIAELRDPVIPAPIDFGRAPGAAPGASGAAGAAGQGGDTSFIAWPYVPGRDLREAVQRDGPLPPERLAAIHRPVVEALARAHARGLAHGAVGPSTIRIDDADRATLVDFGAAAARGPDVADDLRGLACSLLWCATGRPADDAATLDAGALSPALAGLIRQTLQGRTPPLEDFARALAAPAHPASVHPAPAQVASVIAGDDTAPAPRRILIVDDQPFIRSFCRVALEQRGYECAEAADGPAALELFRERGFDMVLLDIDMPIMSGWDVCRELRHIPRQPHLKVILFSGRANPDDLAAMMLAGADDYLTKPFTPVQLTSRVQASLQLQQAQERMDRLNRDLLTVNHELESHLHARDSDLIEARNALVLALAKLAESRDNDTGAHLQRLQVYSRRLAEQALGCETFRAQLDRHFVDMLACCAPLHDIGKVGLPDLILQKPGPLSPEERKLMQTHTVIGAETLREVARRHGFALAFLRMSIDIARHHHERFDGDGYPDRLKGEAIPLAARIVTICDVYDALRSKRVYKPARPHDEVVAEIIAASGAIFDPALIDCFRQCADDFDRIFDQLQD